MKCYSRITVAIVVAVLSNCSKESPLVDKPKDSSLGPGLSKISPPKRSLPQIGQSLATFDEGHMLAIPKGESSGKKKSYAQHSDTDGVVKATILHFNGDVLAAIDYSLLLEPEESSLANPQITSLIGGRTPIGTKTMRIFNLKSSNTEEVLLHQWQDDLNESRAAAYIVGNAARVFVYSPSLINESEVLPDAGNISPELMEKVKRASAVRIKMVEEALKTK